MVWSALAREPFVDFVARAGPGQGSEHGAALAYGTKPPTAVAGAAAGAGGAAASPQPRGPPGAAPYTQQPYLQQLRLHQPGYTLTYSRDGGYSRTVGGAAGGDYVRAVGGGGAAPGRISLLPPAAPTYLAPPPAPPHHPPPADPPPFKKIRLQAERPHIPHLQQTHHTQQLRVDTREPVNTYNNTVEVLSPNNATELTVEDKSFRTTKDDLLQQISKVDREMALSEQSLAKLKRKHEELAQAASRPVKSEEPEVEQPKHRSLAESIYADNMKKAERALSILAPLKCPEQTEHWPLYNQPQDTDKYHENKQTHVAFRRRLLDTLRTAKQERDAKRQQYADAYSKRAVEWQRRVERVEQGQKRKAKEARNREFFEKVFPELRKQREDRERFNRAGARVKSEADLEEIVDSLQEQEMEEKKMRSLAVVPPLVWDGRQRRCMYKDTNGICLDMEKEHKELVYRNVWTDQERELFKEKYLQHPKNFIAIASFLERKSVRDCVRFYYLNKKAELYKQMLRKSRQRRSARNPARNPAPPPDLPAGVTTRLQRSTQGGSGARSLDKDQGMEEGGGGVGVPITCIPMPDSEPLPPPPAEAPPPPDDVPDPPKP